MVFNTISRDLLNSVYNPRFCEFAEEARKAMIRQVYAH